MAPTGPTIRFSEADISLGPEKLVLRHPAPTPPTRPLWWIRVHLLFLWRWLVFHCPRVRIEWR